MEITSTTFGVPVKNLALSRRWYQAVFELDPPEIELVEGIADYQFPGFSLQLSEEPDASATGDVLLRFGVPDVDVEHARLAALDIDVSPIVRVEGAVNFFDFADPDGHTFSLYTVSA